MPATPAITLFGIPNCNTMKKARTWLDANSVDYVFHDYRKDGVPEKKLKAWVKKLGWETLLNRRGTTWRRLDEATRESIDESSAIRVMLDNPAIIRRPVLESGSRLLVGFSEQEYRSLT